MQREPPVTPNSWLTAAGPDRAETQKVFRNTDFQSIGHFRLQ
jgi:hypothetical protein